MKVSAVAKGHDGLAVRVPGEVFDMPDGSRAPWFVTVAEGDEFTESDISAEVKKIADARAATVLAADRAAAVANLVVLRAASARINTAVAHAAELKIVADNASKDARTQMDGAKTLAEREAAAASTARAKASVAAADAAVANAKASNDLFLLENYPNRAGAVPPAGSTVPPAGRALHTGRGAGPEADNLNNR